jgi:hypothetical protein
MMEPDQINGFLVRINSGVGVTGSFHFCQSIRLFLESEREVRGTRERVGSSSVRETEVRHFIWTFF